MTTELIIIAIFCLVDDRMPMIQKHRQAKLYPSEVVTIGILFALKGGHFRAFYRWLKRGLRIDARTENNAGVFYTHRARFNTLVREGREDSREAAALFYYLNRTGYNGLCRFNRSGEFNVPFGRYKRIGYVRNFSAYRGTLAGWEFLAGDFAAAPIAPDDFIYADPPYDVEFRQYAQRQFGWQDQVRTAEWLSTHPGPVVLSNQATDRIVDLYRGLGYTLTFLDGPRLISCTGDRTPAKEVLATRNLQQETRHHDRDWNDDGIRDAPPLGRHPA